MPISNLHKDKKKKNFIVLGLIAFWCLVLFIIAMIKMKAAMGG